MFSGVFRADETSLREFRRRMPRFAERLARELTGSSGPE